MLSHPAERRYQYKRREVAYSGQKSDWAFAIKTQGAASCYLSNFLGVVPARAKIPCRSGKPPMTTPGRSSDRECVVALALKLRGSSRCLHAMFEVRQGNRERCNLVHRRRERDKNGITAPSTEYTATMPRVRANASNQANAHAFPGKKAQIPLAISLRSYDKDSLRRILQGKNSYSMVTEMDSILRGWPSNFLLEMHSLPG